MRRFEVRCLSGAMISLFGMDCLIRPIHGVSAGGAWCLSGEMHIMCLILGSVESGQIGSVDNTQRAMKTVAAILCTKNGNVKP